MLVIGVAEPENESPELKMVAEKKRQEYEEVMGGRLFLVSGILETAGVWGVNGMRQRILVCARPFSLTTCAYTYICIDLQTICSCPVSRHV
jgi:hypothetical protein